MEPTDQDDNGARGAMPIPQILIVEDEALVAANLESLLERLGYRAIVNTADGRAAIDLAGELDPDLVLMDIGLPGEMDGIQAAQEIVRRYKIPVVYLTAHGDPAMLDRAKVTTPFGYLLKPFDERTLHATLEMALQKHTLEKQLRASEAQYHDLFDRMPLGLFRMTLRGKLLEANDALCRLFGYPDRASLCATQLSQHLVDPADGARLMEQLKTQDAVRAFECQFTRRDGATVWVQLDARVALDADGNILCIDGVLEDITSRKQAEEELRRTQEALQVANRDLEHLLELEQDLARTDALTHVHNRRYLFKLAAHEFAVAARYRHPLAVILFDLDHFKLVNDTFGHAVGDQMLERVAQVARAQLREVDVIGRYGGEEFVVALPMTSASQAHPLAERIRENVAAVRVVTPKGDAAVTLSIGIAETLFTPPDDSVDRVIQRADQAMYAAKQAGRNRISIYSAETQGDEP